MRIIVTGSNGFIARHLIPELYGHEIIEYDRTTGHDLRKGIGSLEDIDLVIHLAAKVSRVLGEDDLLETVTDNAAVTAMIARACGETRTRLIYSSSSEIYGDGGETEWHEDHFPVDDYYFPAAKLPHNLYGLSKRWGEEACKLYCPENLTIVRLSMPYGSGLYAGRGKAAIINLLYSALWNMPLRVHNHAERSWCYVSDTVQAIRLLVEEEHRGAFNIGRDDDPRSMLAIAQIACDLTGAPYDLIELSDPTGPQTLVKRLSSKKIRGLGWRPEVDLRDGMGRTLEWVASLPAPSRVHA